MPVSSLAQFGLHATAGHRTFMLCLDTCQVAAVHVLSGSCGAHLGTVPGVSHVRWLHAGRAHVQALCPCANGPPAAVLLQHSQGASTCVPILNDQHRLLASDAGTCLQAGLRACEDALKPGQQELLRLLPGLHSDWLHELCSMGNLYCLCALLSLACLLYTSPLPACLQAMLRYDSDAREVRLVADRAYHEGGSILVDPPPSETCVLHSEM